jgi:hypothetical protein
VPKQRFVSAAVVRLPLSDGDWIEIKERLSWGEQNRLSGAGLTSFQADGGRGFNWEKWNLARIETWLVDWSFRDEADKPVRVSADAIAALDPETAAEIMAAIDAHVEAQEASKKAGAGATTSTPA